MSINQDGTRVALGAPFGGWTHQQGHVRVFEWIPGLSGWRLLGAQLDGGGNQYWFGSAVCLSSDGTRLAVGAPYKAGSAAGAVSVFEWDSGTTSWGQLGADIDGTQLQEKSGWSVDLSADGTRVVVGAPYHDGAGSDEGNARVYEWDSGTTAWVEVGAGPEV